MHVLTQLLRPDAVRIAHPPSRAGVFCRDFFDAPMWIRCAPRVSYPGAFRFTVERADTWTPPRLQYRNPLRLRHAARAPWEVTCAAHELADIELLKFVARVAHDPERAGYPRGVAIDVRCSNPLAGGYGWTAAANMIAVVP
jgi:hypothetical protein